MIGELLGVLSSTLAVVLVATGFGKLLAAKNTTELTLLTWLFESHGRYVARSLGVIEILIGVSLFPADKGLHLISLCAAVALLATASITIHQGLKQDIKPSCGCGGAVTEKVNHAALLRTVALTSIGLVCLFLNGLTSHVVIANRLVGSCIGVGIVLLTPSWRPDFPLGRSARERRLIRRLQTRGCSGRRLPFSARLMLRRAVRDEAFRAILNDLPAPIDVVDKWSDCCWRYILIVGHDTPSKKLVLANHIFNKWSLRHHLIENSAEILSGTQ